MKFLKSFIKDEQGQDLIEYTLLLAFVALAAAALFTNIGTSITNIWTGASTTLGTAPGATAPTGGG